MSGKCEITNGRKVMDRVRDSTNNSDPLKNHDYLNLGMTSAAFMLRAPEYVSESGDLPFPDTIDEFKRLQDYVQIDENQPRCFTFGEGKNKFRLAVTTCNRLLDSKERSLSEVDLSLPANEIMPDLKCKSRKQILEILANNVGPDHEKLLNALNERSIQHIVCSYTKNVFVKNCDWDTLVKISNLVNELNCDLIISGGGIGEYLSKPAESSIQCPTKTKEYQDKISKSCKTYKSVRNVKVGVIDSGCSSSLRNKLVSEGKVVMYDKMINTTDDQNEQFYDCYIKPNEEGHGTGVMEIITNCVIRNTEIYVASVGYVFTVSSVIEAINKLFNLGVEIVNCSFRMPSDSMHLIKTLQNVKSTEKIIIVAAAGNSELESIDSGLNDGKTIMAGSHNYDDFISCFSDGKCKANVCSLGEGVYIPSVTPNLRSGTSFAAPHVTAALANLLSHLQISPNEIHLRQYLKETAGNLFCTCSEHKGQSEPSKLDSRSIMQKYQVHF